MRDPFSPGPFGGSDFMFTLMPIIILIGFVVVLALMIRAIAGNVRNARAPRQTVYARVVAKRMQVWGDNSHTHYFITLEFENGERREFHDVKNLYGLVVEGDVGYAAIQGDWIVAFERRPPADPYRGSGW
jgi:hypothetical protein